MKKTTVLLVALIIAASAFCQSAASQSGQILKQKENYQERLFITTNDHFFIPGERLFFSVHCFLPSSYSFLSKVAYIELIDESKNVVLRTSVILEKGKGSGHLYLPSYLRTAPYQLIAYTTWMQNYDHTFIPQVALHIVNPYEPLPEKITGQDSLNLLFFPEGGRYTIGRSNSVIFLNKGMDIPFDGRVLDPDGELVATFESSGSDPGHFNFSPDSLGKYKVVLTTAAGDIYFSELNVEKFSNLGLKVQEGEKSFEMHVSNQSREKAVLAVTSYTDPDWAAEYPVAVDSAVFLLDKSKVPAGLLLLQLSSDASETVDRLLFNPPNLAPIYLATDKEVYKPRENVQLTIEGPEEASGEEVVALVRKIYGSKGFQPVPHSLLTTGLAEPILQLDDYLDGGIERLHNLLVTKKAQPVAEQEAAVWRLPDFRGQLISGRLKNLQEKGRLVYLSSGPPDYDLFVSSTNEQGQIFFNTTGLSGETELIITSFDDPLAVEMPAIEDHSFLHNHRVSNDSSLLSWLLRKSIDVQVENAYYHFREDSVVSSPTSFVRRTVDKTYAFDEYARFPTMEDVIVEITAEISIRKNKNKSTLIMPYISASAGADSALVLLDGVPVTTAYLLRLNPLLLEKVDLTHQQVQVGAADFRGIANFQTFKKDHSFVSPSYSTLTYPVPQEKVAYYQPNHSAPDKMPDFRNQLLWKPELILGEDTELDFYTSDLTGTFEIVVYGMTGKGEIVYGKKIIRVIESDQ